MQLLLQIGMEDNKVIADILLWSKMQIDNPGVYGSTYRPKGAKWLFYLRTYCVPGKNM